MLSSYFNIAYLCINKRKDNAYTVKYTEGYNAETKKAVYL